MIVIHFMIFAFLAPEANAQDAFRLSDYVNPDYHWKRLDMDFGLGGNNTYSRNTAGDDNDLRNTRNSMNSNINLDYFNTRNSRHYQGSQTFWVSGNVASSLIRDNDAGSDIKDDHKFNDQNAALGVVSINRFYNSRKQFIETDFVLDGRYAHSSDKFNSDMEEFPYTDKQVRLQYGVSGSVSVLLGLGRVEDVQDARLAKYIVDDLYNSGDLKRMPDNEELFELARFITSLKNQRSFDSRIRKIEEITAVDSFLIEKGLKADSDASYYTLLNDNWDYAAGPARSTGHRFSFGVVPGIDFGFTDYKQFYRDSIMDQNILASFSDRFTRSANSWGLDAVVMYQWEKPSSLRWQHSFNAMARYALFHQRVMNKNYEEDVLTAEVKDILNEPNLVLQCKYGMGYYPNTRTYLTMFADAGFGKYWGEEELDDNLTLDVGRTEVFVGLGIECYYYITQQLRFTLHASSDLAYNHRNPILPDEGYLSHDDTNIYSRITAGFTYSIF